MSARLTPNQQKVVAHREGAILVVAGPRVRKNKGADRTCA